MANPSKKAVAGYRRRMKRRGVVRLEVNVRKDDAPLVRSVVAALNDPQRADDTRVVLRERFSGAARGFKELLARAPIDGLDLERLQSTAREIDL